MEGKLIKEVNELKERVVTLEKIVGRLVEIEEINPEKLTKEESIELKKALANIKRGKFISLEELKRKLEID